MTAAIRTWWKGRTLREQRMLLALALVLGLTLGWLLIVKPLADMRADVLRRHEAAVAMLAETRARADAISSAAARAVPASTEPIATLVSAAATEAGFTINRLDGAADGSATLTIAAARPQAFFAWVADMEARRGLVVNRLTASINSDQTLSVQVTFGKRGG